MKITRPENLKRFSFSLAAASFVFIVSAFAAVSVMAHTMTEPPTSFPSWSNPLEDDTPPGGFSWATVANTYTHQDDPDVNWANSREIGWTVPGLGIVGVDVYGGSDDGGYCYAWWSGASPGWVAEYRHEGQIGLYNQDGLFYDSSNGFCPTYPPTFDAGGNAQICQVYWSHGNFEYGANYTAPASSKPQGNYSVRGDVSGIYIPPGTVINLQARHTVGKEADHSYCFLAVKYADQVSCDYTAPPSLETCEMSVRYADKNGRDSASWKEWAPLESSVNIDFVGDVNSDDDFDVMVRCEDTQIQNKLELCRRYADSNGRDSASWQCADFGTPLLTDFVGNVNSDDDLDFMIRAKSGQTVPVNNCGLGVRYADGNNRNNTSWRYAHIGDSVNTDMAGNVDDNDDFDLKLTCDLAGPGCMVPPRSVCELHPAGPEWTARYKPPSSGPAYGYATAADGAGNAYLAGEAFNLVSATSGADVFLAKYDSSGRLLWERRYDKYGNESGYGMAAQAGGGVYVTGRIDGNNGDMLLLKFDADGNLLWDRAYDNANGSDIGQGIAADAARVFVAGHRQRFAGGDTDAMLWTLDGDGNVFSTQTYDAGGDNESAFAVAVRGIDLFITGYQSTNAGDMFLRKYVLAPYPIPDNAFGWQGTVTYDSKSAWTDSAVTALKGDNCKTKNPVSSFKPSFDGTVRATVGLDGSHWTDGIRLKLQCDGADCSDIACGPDKNNAPFTSAALTTNYEVAAGTTVTLAAETFEDRESGNDDCLAWGNQSYCYNSNVNEISNIRWDNLLPFAFTDVGRGAAISADGRTVFVTGYQSRNNGDMFSNAYNAADGALRWSNFYDSAGSGGDIGRAAAAGGRNRVYVSGHQGTNNDDVLFREYFSANYVKAFQVMKDIVRGGMNQEMGYGLAIDLSTGDEPLYVSGYQDSNGGEAFLSRYSCNPPADAGSISNGYFTVSPANIYTNVGVYVDATQSGPGISEYEWDWSYSGSPANFVKEDEGVKNSHVYGVPGQYTIALRITHAKTEIITQQINVYDNHQPTAAFSVAPSSGAAPLMVTVSDAGSEPDGDSNSNLDPGDYIKNFTWDWGDGTPKGYGAQATHLYSRPSPPGGYIITLTVEDSIGAPNSFATSAPQTVTVTEQYICSGGCGTDKPACWLSHDGASTDCFQCVPGTEYQCGPGYECAGSRCKAGQMCPDGVMECPADGICPEAVACKVGSDDLCPDGSACPESGLCAPAKNFCKLASDTLPAQCYIEALAPQDGACSSDLDCSAGVQGGVCDLDSESDTYQQCKYARCLNSTAFSCEKDADCNNSDGICYEGTSGTSTCQYVYDCAYGPGLGGMAGAYASTSPKVMPKMPIGVQPNGEACTKPTPDAPNNCSGINGCLYYNYNGDGTAVPGDAGNTVGNGVTSCLDKLNGGTGCIYYGDQTTTATSTQKVNCLPGTDFSRLKPKTAPGGIPAGCVVVEKGGGKKEYNCTAVDGCYYHLDGWVDCDYQGGTGCVYEPAPVGAIACPAKFKVPTAGPNFIQCLLNPDAVLPSFLSGGGEDALSPCRVDEDCPEGQVCIGGTCFPPCQNGQDCGTGAQCIAVPPPVKFSCSNTTAVTDLPYGTSDAPISVETNRAAACRWSLFDLPFDSMTGPGSGSFVSGDLLVHTGVADGFFTGYNKIYVQCQDAGSSANFASCGVGLTVGNTCDENTDCAGNLVCINGWCQAPTCSGASPTGSLSYETLTTGTMISMSTGSKNSNCVFSDTYDDTNACVTPILSCSTAAPFSVTGGTTHTSFLPGSSLAVGNNTQYAKCQAIDPPQNLSPTCQIPFSGLMCNKDYPCAGGWVCSSDDFDPGICEPPACSGAIPPYPCAPGADTCAISEAGPTCPAEGFCPMPLVYTTTNADIGMTTDAPANCSYGDSWMTEYGGMTAFTTTGGTSHAANITVNAGANKKYVKCLETDTGEISGACTIKVQVGMTCSEKQQCDNGYSCDKGVCVRPICSGAYPTGQQTVGETVAIGLTTDSVSTCKYSDADVPYDEMLNMFLSIGGLTHGTDGELQNTVTVVSGNNTKYVKCRAEAAPNLIKLCRIPFHGGPCSVNPGDCEFGFDCNIFTEECEDPCLSENPPDSCFTEPPPPKPCPPFCPSPPPPPTPLTCNTLGYEFHGSAITPTGNCDIVAIIVAVISWIMWFVVLLAVLSGLYAAYLYITSAGDEKKLRLAYKYLIYTVIGLGVAIISFSLIAITRAILNI